MKIVFTGGGTGGHFYPIIAVAQSVQKIVDHEKIVGLEMYYYSDSPYDKQALFETGLAFEYIPAGKRRIYASAQNFFDLFKTGFGFLSAFGSLFFLYPDVVFSKGGYASFPVVLAARFLGIPIVIHESDTVPGRANVWAGKFAKKIAISYDESSKFFPANKVALTGQPIREELLSNKVDGAFEYLKLDPTIPTILILGGSLGADAINNVIVDALPELIKKYQIVHQTGINNFEDVKLRTDFLLHNNELARHYKVFPFLNPLAMKMAAEAAALVVTRAGSTLFEIASWGIPGIVVPIDSSNGDHQKKNAYNYARHGCGRVIEEGNFSPAVLEFQIKRFFDEDVERRNMIAASKVFGKQDAAEKIARLIVDMSLAHES